MTRPRRRNGITYRVCTLYTTYTVELWDRIAQQAVTVTRRGEDYAGYHAMGRISYRGERLRLLGGAGGYGWAEDYPPPLPRCRTERARAWRRAQETAPPDSPK